MLILKGSTTISTTILVKLTDGAYFVNIQYGRLKPSRTDDVISLRNEIKAPIILPRVSYIDSFHQSRVYVIIEINQLFGFATDPLREEYGVSKIYKGTRLRIAPYMSY